MNYSNILLRAKLFVNLVNYAFSLGVSIIMYNTFRKFNVTLGKVKDILIIRDDDSIVGVFLDSILIRELKKKDYNVDVLIVEQHSEFVLHNPNVRDIYTVKSYHNKLRYDCELDHNLPNSLITKLKENKYSLIIDPYYGPTPVRRMKFFHDIKAQDVIGINNTDLLHYYNHSIKFDPKKQEMLSVYKGLLTLLDIESDETHIDLYYSNGIDNELEDWLSTINKDKNAPIVVFNVSNDIHHFSAVQVTKITESLHKKYPDINIIIIDNMNEISNTLTPGVHKYPYQKMIYHVISLIKHADLIISPISYINAVGNFYDKSLITLSDDCDDFILGNKLFIKMPFVFDKDPIIDKKILNACSYIKLSRK